jgi:LPXTG-motif cell wall-anchored protein
LPAYQGSTDYAVTVGSTSTTSTSTHTATLVGENGSGVLFVVGIPLAVVVLVGAMLMLRRRRRRHGAGPLAWTVVGLLGGFTFLAMLTIGIFIIPVVVMLAIACATAPEDPRAHL